MEERIVGGIGCWGSAVDGGISTVDTGCCMEGGSRVAVGRKATIFVTKHCDK